MASEAAAPEPRSRRQCHRQEDDIWDNSPAIDRKAIADTQAVEIALGNQDAPYDAEKFIDERFIPKDYVKLFSYPTRTAGSSN